jgi:hypothetical protein
MLRSLLLISAADYAAAQAAVAAAAAVEPTVLSANPLRGLPALRTPHYSWPFPEVGNLGSAGPKGGYLANASASFLDGFLHDYVRITGSCPLSLVHTSEVEVATCASICAANTAEPKRCLAINYSPWYAKFPSHDPTITGPPEDAEMAFFSGLLVNVTAWLAKADSAGTVGVGAILLDQEKFSAQTGSPVATVDALTRKCDLIWNASTLVFPTARIEWYNRGSVSFSNTCECPRALASPCSCAAVPVHVVAALIPLILKTAMTRDRGLAIGTDACTLLYRWLDRPSRSHQGRRDPEAVEPLYDERAWPLTLCFHLQHSRAEQYLPSPASGYLSICLISLTGIYLFTILGRFECRHARTDRLHDYWSSSYARGVPPHGCLRSATE